MPGIKGPELADRLRVMRPGIRVLLMSGYAADVVTAGDLKDAILLSKPFSPSALVTRRPRQPSTCRFPRPLLRRDNDSVVSFGGHLMTRVLTALALIAAVALPTAAAAQTGKPSLMNPASLNEQAPPTYNVKFDTSAGRIRHHRDARLGAVGRRSLLQPREERLLRRHALLPRRPELHGAVGHQRRSRHPAQLGQRQHQGRSGRRKEQRPRLRHVRQPRAELALDAAVHQLQVERVPRQDLHAVRRGDVGDVGGRQDQPEHGESPDQGADAGQRQPLPAEGLPEPRLHQEGDDRAGRPAKK